MIPFLSWAEQKQEKLLNELWLNNMHKLKQDFLAETAEYPNCPFIDVTTNQINR